MAPTSGSSAWSPPSKRVPKFRHRWVNDVVWIGREGPGTASTHSPLCVAAQPCCRSTTHCAPLPKALCTHPVKPRNAPCTVYRCIMGCAIPDCAGNTQRIVHLCLRPCPTHCAPTHIPSWSDPQCVVGGPTLRRVFSEKPAGRPSRTGTRALAISNLVLGLVWVSSMCI